MKASPAAARAAASPDGRAQLTAAGAVIARSPATTPISKASSSVMTIPSSTFKSLNQPWPGRQSLNPKG